MCSASSCQTLAEDTDVLQEVARFKSNDLLPVLSQDGALVAGVSVSQLAESRRCAPACFTTQQCTLGADVTALHTAMLET